MAKNKGRASDTAGNAGQAKPAAKPATSAGTDAAASGGDTSASLAGEDDATGKPAAGKSAHTFTAPSGKHYVLAQEGYPEEVPCHLRSDIVAASDGDLLELFLVQDGWGYGRRFKAREGAVNEGVFSLSWVQGVRLAVASGQRQPVEVDIFSADYGFRPPRANDVAGKLRLKRYRKKLGDVAEAWSKLEAEQAPSLPAGTISAKGGMSGGGIGGCGDADATAEAAAARAAEALLRRQEAEEEVDRARQVKAGLRRAQQRQKRQQALPPEVRAAGAPGTLEEDEEASPVHSSSHGGSRGTVSSGAELLCASLGRHLSSRPFAPLRRQRPRPVCAQTWEAHWERQAAHLESMLSASSSGVEESMSDGSRSRQRPPTVQKKMLTRKVARSLLQAKRSGELHAIAEEWEKAHTEMANKASDMSALMAKVKRSLLNAHRVGDLERIAEEMAGEAERKAAEVKALKERVFRAMIDMKRARDLEKTTSDMDDAQKELEMQALQLKSLMKRAWQGMVESRRISELERIADEMAEQLQTKAEALKHKIRSGLLQAHRTGELLEIRDELDELADSVTALNDEAAAVARGEAPSSVTKELLCSPKQRRWSEFPSSDSDSSCDPLETLRRRAAARACRDGRSGALGAWAGLAAEAPAPMVHLAMPDLPGSGVRAFRERRLLGSPGEADVSGSEDAESNVASPICSVPAVAFPTTAAAAAAGTDCFSGPGS
mmetsp:Transcript_177748/g.569911  ORF Transcript_177748/g.569911 Transcript_177748/m.569911 type:complete len:718 (+) Transcript_177748:53-2206(+)